MRATLTLDDELLARARALTGLSTTSAIVREVLAALVARESALRLARLSGSEPQLRPIPGRRPSV